MKKSLFIVLFSLSMYTGFCQSPVSKSIGENPYITEMWTPVPQVVKPGATPSDPPSDAIILFDGKSTSAWKSESGDNMQWTVAEGILTVKPRSGNISTVEQFGDCQLHIEWRAPAAVSGEGQGRGNSGIFLMGRYEIQVLDSYENKTYSNGQAASIYKQYIPLVNTSKKPGEWQTYDIIFMAPRFNTAGMVKSPPTVTVIHNGVLVQNHVTLLGSTEYIGLPKNEQTTEKGPLVLQDHQNEVSYRNIWIRNL